MSQLLPKEAVAARLDVAPRTVLRLARAQQLASVRVGSRVKFDARDVEAFIARQRRAPALPDPVDATPAPLPPIRRRRFS